MTVAMTLQEELAKAFRLHHSGSLTAAGHHYEAILSRDPQQVDALQLLGVLRQQQGQFAQAVLLGSGDTIRTKIAPRSETMAAPNERLRPPR